MNRACDVTVALPALVLLAPVMVLVAAAVALESGRPVLYRQVRVGQGGREFMLFKFRSMVTGADAGGYETAQEDPRVTRVGRFLRRTSLDELPQLFNVLRGDMSLVGPRPDVPAQRTLYTPADWALRCAVRPGITGLAQALLRSEATPGQRLALDLQYVRERGFLLDLRILWLTLRRLGGRGSN